MPARDTLTSVWLLCRFGHFLPQTGNGKEHQVAREWQWTPLFCLIPHCSSLLPLLFDYPTTTRLPPLLSSLIFSTPFGRRVCRTGRWRQRLEERTGIARLKRDFCTSAEDLLISRPHFLFQDPRLFLSAWDPFGCAATHTLLQTTPTMYLTVQYCAKLASHDKFVLYPWWCRFNLSLICLHNWGCWSYKCIFAQFTLGEV